MAFARPTLRRLISRAKSDIEALLENGASRLRRSVEYVMAHVLAGLAHGLHGHIKYLADNIVPTRADDEWLVRWAGVWGLNRNPATQAKLSILATGTASSSIPQGTQWISPGGVIYEVDATTAIPGSAPLEVSVNITAVVTPSDPDNGTGADGNAEGGSTVSLVNPVAGIDSEASVEGDVGELQGGGADIETIEALRTRLLERIQTPPSGGGPGDYIEWAKTVSGVTRAWELPQQMGPGTVVVLFVQDVLDDDGNFIDTIFPSAGTIATVQAALDEQAPVTATPIADAPIEQLLNPSIQLEPNDATTQAQVTALLNDLLLRRASPGGTLLLSEIDEAISLAANETDHVLVSPAANVTTAATTLLTLGTPTFNPIP